MTLTNNASIIGHLWRLIESYGENPKEVLDKFKLNLEMTDDPGIRFPYAITEKIWQTIIEKANDPLIGFRSAELWHPSSAGPLGYAWLTSSTLREAFYRLERYLKIVTEGVFCHVEENQGQFKLVHRFHDNAQNIPELADSHLAIMIRLCRLNYGDSIIPLGVALQRPSPEDSTPFCSFFRCPVYFDQPENHLLFTSKEMDERLPSGNKVLAQMNDQIIIDYLAQLEPESIIEKTKQIIIGQLPSGKVTDESVATTLNLSRRTLHRRLHENQTTFRLILNDIRHHLADQYIRDNRLNFKEISYLLGFSEMSAFSRAFKRWTGKSPTRYRHQIYQENRNTPSFR